MALGGIELETLVSEPDALTTRPELFLGSHQCSGVYVATLSEIFITCGI